MSFVLAIGFVAVQCGPLREVETRYSCAAKIDHVVWAGTNPLLLVGLGGRSSIGGSAVYLKHEESKLVHWLGVETRVRPVAVGFAPTGEQLIGYYSSIGAKSWFHASVGPPLSVGRLQTKRYPSTALKKGEKIFGFLPSKPGYFLSTHRIGNSLVPEDEVLFDEPLPFHKSVHADMSATSCLVAFNSHDGATVLHISGKRVTPLNLFEKTEPESKSSKEMASWVVSGLLADRENHDDFFLSIGAMRRPGRLLKVSSDGSYKVILRRREPKQNFISGIAERPLQPSGEMTDQPILDIAYGNDGKLAVLFPRVLVTLLEDGRTVEIGEPSFSRVGDFYFSMNLAGFGIVLTERADKIAAVTSPNREACGVKYTSDVILFRKPMDCGGHGKTGANPANRIGS